MFHMASSATHFASLPMLKLRVNLIYTHVFCFLKLLGFTKMNLSKQLYCNNFVKTNFVNNEHYFAIFIGTMN